MPQPEESDKVDDAVLWAYAGTDINGLRLVGAPANVRVRWVNTKRDGKSPASSNATTDAQISVNQAIAVGSLMWLGTVATIPVSGDFPDGELMEVISGQHAKDIKGQVDRWEYSLMKYGTRLPINGVTGA